MTVIPISAAVAVQLRERGILPLLPGERDLPDNWLALLEQMNGSCEAAPNRPPVTAAPRATPGGRP